MDSEVPVISADQHYFMELPKTARFAILLPTGRWTSTARSIFGSLLGVANEEVIVLIADNSENEEKRQYLKKIRSINPYIFVVSHEKNVGLFANSLYLFNWCHGIEFTAFMADDDWFSHSYYLESYRALLQNTSASCVSAGGTFINTEDGKFVDIGQPSIVGNNPLERMQSWNCVSARITSLNTSRRTSYCNAMEYIWTSPLSGLTMGEDIIELNRLSCGDFLNVAGSGCYIHCPAHGSRVGDGTQRFYNLLCKDAGLQYPMVYFMALSTAIQCALFLKGRMSAIADAEQRELCSQYVFKHIFISSFLPKVSGESGHTAAASMFANHPEALAGFLTYCNPTFSEQLAFDQAIIEWFIEIVKVFELKPIGGEIPVSERFRLFVKNILNHS